MLKINKKENILKTDYNEALKYFKSFTNEALREIISIASKLMDSKIKNEIIETCTYLIKNTPEYYTIGSEFHGNFQTPNYLNMEVNNYIETRKNPIKRLELKK